jgi:redox-sensitive bicupin YhaK (pirin superfamily)
MASSGAGERIRSVARVVTSFQTLEGGGFPVHRPFPTSSLGEIDPFLLLDRMGPYKAAPGQAKGAPDHPHRGFETVTYLIDGEMEHEDSAGNRGKLGPGDVQWMTAGAGVVHSEMPSRSFLAGGGRMHGFQLWVNLPRRDKMIAPRYQDVPASRIPVVTSPDGQVRVKVIAGEAMGARAVIDTHTPIVYQDWSLAEGADVTVAVGRDHRALAYVFEGSVLVGERGGGRLVADGQMALLGPGDGVRLRGAPGGGRLLLLGGVPLGEPIARYGPFVMNNDAELVAAFQDYQSGRMGEITRTAKVAKVG